MKKLVFGVGLNDADYPVFIKEDVKGSIKRKQKVVWRCKYYLRWTNMLQRCYSSSYQKKYPTYRGSYVCDHWKVFSNFRYWLKAQEVLYESVDKLQLDKDVLLDGNKLYSPETCIMVHPTVNKFLNDHGNSRGVHPIGVSLVGKRFRGECSDPFGGSRYIGLFSTPEDAHVAWRLKKLEYSKSLAYSSLVKDERLKTALLKRSFTLEDKNVVL